MVPKLVADLLTEVAHAENCALPAELGKLAEQMLEEGAPIDIGERLGPVANQRTQSRPQSASENQCLARRVHFTHDPCLPTLRQP
jgi:hypothetical protein